MIPAFMPTAPYGAWPSPVSAAMAAAAGVRLSEPWLGSGGSTWWLERRPGNGGRTTLVRDGEDVTAPEVNVRTRVHEYGGGAWLLYDDTAFFSEYSDQRLYRLDPGAAPRAITPEPPHGASIRYADGRATPDGELILCVRETHGEGEPVNDLVAVPADGSSEPRVIASGRDFYANPRPSPDGTQVCWTCWDHPNMPWDGTELWVAPLDDPASARQVAGGPGESIWQPSWCPEGVLHWVSDRDGWWNIYREGEQVTDEQAELGYPQWLLGGSTYDFLPDGSIVCVRVQGAVERLGVLRPGESRLEDLGLPYDAVGYPYVKAQDDRVVLVAAGPTEEEAVVSWSAREGARVVRQASDEPLDPAWAPMPRMLEYESAGGRTSHALWYPPTNPDFEAPDGELPPVIVQVHGGPTAHVTPILDLEIVFWTSRGIGVVDVNYGGSSGYGRPYRQSLNGQWGVVDVEDCVAAAVHLAAEGEADGNRLAIHGGSAGGYTTLCALAFGDDFAAGASYYGVADAETMAADTHKFESRYLDALFGPYPETRALWRERSPIHYADQIDAPVILFQGLEDKVVPPSQSEDMVAALAARGVPHAYIAFEDEQHGFRKAETLERCLESELSFFAQVFGFEPADDLDPVDIA
jgi:dipeptidyl aminopeptidase/acylaminoacyl peptidase